MTTGRQEQLLDQLGAIMLAEGFAQLRIEDMAARLHCSRATLYKMAPSRSCLLELVFNHVGRAWIARAQEQAELASTGAQRVVVYAESMALSQSAAVPQLWSDAQAFPPTKAALDARSMESSRNFKRYLDQGVEDGSIRPMSTTFIATVILLAARVTRDPDVLRDSGLNAEQAMLELASFIRSGLSEPFYDSPGPSRPVRSGDMHGSRPAVTMSRGEQYE